MSPTPRKGTSNEIDVFNTTRGPVFIDEDQHMIGGGEWATVESTPQVKAALRDGYLIEPGKIKPAKESDDEDDQEIPEPPAAPEVTVTTVPPGPTTKEN